MKTATKLVLLPLVLALGTTGFAHASQDCAAKRAAIEYQISQAKAYGNHYKVAGLERSLAKVNAYCGVNSGHGNSNMGDNQASTDVSKLVQKVQKLEKQLITKKTELQNIQYELNMARAKGNYKKVTKLQTKLMNKKSELVKAQQELNIARAELNAAKR